MTRRLLDYDPLTGISTWFQYENSTDQMAITTEQDIAPIIDSITARRNDAWMRAHPFVVEEEKRQEERGRYLTPEAFGEPVTLRIGVAKEPAAVTAK